MTQNIVSIDRYAQTGGARDFSGSLAVHTAVSGSESTELDYIGELFETIATDAFYPRLSQLLHLVARFNDFAVITLRSNMLPSSPFAECEYHSAEACDAFVQGLYAQSPFYHCYREGGSGFKVLDELAPEGFQDSGFYQDYMLPARLKDEAAFIIPGDRGTVYLVCLGRCTRLSKFTAEEAKSLRRYAGVVGQAVVNHERLLTQSATQVIEYCSSLGNLESKLSQFTSTTLTEREREILGYLIRGYSSKACARVLDIATSTERVHRKNIYQKLGVSSQSELLATVFDRLFA